MSSRGAGRRMLGALTVTLLVTTACAANSGVGRPSSSAPSALSAASSAAPPSTSASMTPTSSVPAPPVTHSPA